MNSQTQKYNSLDYLSYKIIETFVKTYDNTYVLFIYLINYLFIKDILCLQVQCKHRVSDIVLCQHCASFGACMGTCVRMCLFVFRIIAALNISDCTHTYTRTHIERKRGERGGREREERERLFLYCLYKMIILSLIHPSLYRERYKYLVFC